MNPHQKARSHGTNYLLRLLAATLITAAIAVTVACSGEQPPPTHRPQTSDRNLSKTIEAMASETETLHTKVANPSPQTSDQNLSKTIEAMASETETLHTKVANPSHTASVVTLLQGQETLPPHEASVETPTPAAITAPTPEGPGICGRSPKTQREILDRLNLQLCHLATNDQLFRIENFALKMETVRNGDFDGLVNVKSTALTAKHIETAGLSGLENLQTLQLTINTNGSISPGTFQGLNNLETLEITVDGNGSISPGAFQSLTNLDSLRINPLESRQLYPSENYHKSGDTLTTLPDFDHLPSLKRLEITNPIPMGGASSTDTLFKNLPILEYLIAEFQGDVSLESERTYFTISSGLFKHNPSLKSVKLKAGHNNLSVEIPGDLFAENPLLEEIIIDGQFRLPKNTFAHLQNLKHLRLGAYYTGDGGSKGHQIGLHESSPQHNLITSGKDHSTGYTLVESE